MKLLLLLASLLIITIPNVHSRILQEYTGGSHKARRHPTSSPGIFHSAGRDKFETSIISSAYGRQKPSPPPSPSPSKRQSARGTISSPCDHDIITIRSPPPPINSAGRDESETIISSVGSREGPTLPPPALPRIHLESLRLECVEVLHHL
ncbi:hypothetical protein TIFTF001_005908 [Ficus carica]|uniref:Uncharacterized protein n=1 Tax=Ficus carica TaxID=3494 RepID=A0AA88CZ58_FICCA|nr:hypothetical protein TIFTF001_005908 [Ficus carica]